MQPQSSRAPSSSNAAGSGTAGSSQSADDWYLNQGLFDPSPAVIDQSIKALRKTRGEDPATVIQIAKATFDHPDPEIRQAGVVAAVENVTPQTLEYFRESLLDPGRSETFRRNCLRPIFTSGDRSYIQAALDILGTDAGKILKINIIAFLKEKMDDGIAAALTRELRSAGDLEVKQAILKLYGNSSHDHVCEAIVNCCMKNPTLIDDAINYLGENRKHPLIEQELVRIALKEPDKRLIALQKLQGCSDRDALEKLLVMFDDTDRNILNAAFEVFHSSPVKMSNEVTQKILSRNDEDVIIAILKVLSLDGSEDMRFRLLLVARLEDKNETIRNEAARVLAADKHQLTQDALKDFLLRHGEQVPPATMRKILASIPFGHREAVLKGLLEAKYFDFQQLTNEPIHWSKFLKSNPSPYGYSILLKYLTGDVAYIKNAAVKALTGVSEGFVVDWLVDSALRSNSQTLRENAITILAYSSAPKAKQAMAELLSGEFTSRPRALFGLVKDELDYAAIRWARIMQNKIDNGS